VAHELPQTPNNAFLHLFAADEERRRYGAAHFKRRSPVSTFMDLLVAKYIQEGWAVPYTLEQAEREQRERYFRTMPDEDKKRIVEALPPEKRLEGIPPEKRLEGLSLDEMLKALPPEAMEELRRRLAGK
ncbi:MAG: hypothetical protein K2W96_03835, partial [Gemmataceae bacterium]|nr:hypothetical protein [Gemmataceae bacterium]